MKRAIVRARVDALARGFHANWSICIINGAAEARR
jgi:hypothetical protein